MTRPLARRTLLAALSLGTALLAACADPVSPNGDDDCVSGTYGGSGTRQCPTMTPNASSGTYGGSGT